MTERVRQGEKKKNITWRGEKILGGDRDRVSKSGGNRLYVGILQPLGDRKEVLGLSLVNGPSGRMDTARHLWEKKL